LVKSRVKWSGYPDRLYCSFFRFCQPCENSHRVISPHTVFVVTCSCVLLSSFMFEDIQMFGNVSKKLKFREISNSHGGECEDDCLLGCCAV
jgi:hypothetical protein